MHSSQSLHNHKTNNDGNTLSSQIENCPLVGDIRSRSCGSGAFFCDRLGRSQSPNEVTISCRNGDVVRFQLVQGTSNIPLDYVLRERNPSAKQKRDPVSIPTFWIAEELVTEGLFADVMGRPVREGRQRRQILSDIEWAEAFEFCRQFTELYTGQMPEGCFATLPTNLEWAHAMDVLGRPSAFMNAPVGAFLFIGNPDGGFLHTIGSFVKDHPADEKNLDAAFDFAIIGKRQEIEYVGVRLVLSNWTGGQVESKGKPVDNAQVSRGVVLLQHGLFDESQSMLESALEKGMLSDDERKRAEDALAFGKEHREYDIEDWGGLVKRAMDYAESHGFRTDPFAELWNAPELLGQLAGVGELADYAVAGIRGKWMRIGDLPQSVRAEQSVGEKYDLLVLAGGSVESHSYTISDDTRVQVLECDFSGDGRTDLVVEEFGSVGSIGYSYGFWESLPDGSYVCRKSLQVVGLCALPSKNGGACGFVTIEKYSNPVLVPRLLTFRDGKAVHERIGTKPVFMSDAHEDRLYLNAPFIGAGYGMGWKLLEGSYGIFFRPLFWVWEPGSVQGFP